MDKLRCWRRCNTSRLSKHKYKTVRLYVCNTEHQDHWEGKKTKHREIRTYFPCVLWGSSWTSRHMLWWSSVRLVRARQILGSWRHYHFMLNVHNYLFNHLFASEAPVNEGNEICELTMAVQFLMLDRILYCTGYRSTLGCRMSRVSRLTLFTSVSNRSSSSSLYARGQRLIQ